MKTLMRTLTMRMRKLMHLKGEGARGATAEGGGYGDNGDCGVGQGSWGAIDVGPARCLSQQASPKDEASRRKGHPYPPRLETRGIDSQPPPFHQPSLSPTR